MALSPLPSSERQGLGHTLTSLGFSHIRLVDTSHAPGLVMGLGTETTGFPQGAVTLGTIPQGEPVCPQSGLELKLEVQGEVTWVIDTE